MKELIFGSLAQWVDPSADGLLSFMYHVYVLNNKLSNKIYIGQTENLEKRLRQHNDKTFKKRSYTKLNKGEWILIYQKKFKTRKKAIRREKELKSSRGRDFIYETVLGR